MNDIKCLYSGVDGLDVAFMGALPQSALDALADAKDRAQEQQLDAMIMLGKCEVSVGVTGSKGGYAYRVTTGEDGEIWWFKKNPNRREWNIRVSVRALAFSLYGYEGVKARLYERLEAFGATVLQESIGRIDICADLQMDGFKLDPEYIVSPPQSTQVDHGEIEIARKARTVQTVTMGKMPGRQICIYNKRAEAKIKRNWHWFDIWGLDRDENSSTSPVWRIELRAGKKYLSEQLNVKSWDELEAILPDFITMTMDSYRLVSDRPGKNVSRWPTSAFWLNAKRRLMAVTDGELSGIVPGRMVTGKRAVIDNTYQQLIVGIAASLAEVRRTDDVNALASDIALSIVAASKDIDDWQRRRGRAKRRISIVDDWYVQQGAS